MGWQEFLALGLVAVCAWFLIRKLLGKSKNPGACENCAPVKGAKKPKEQL